MTSPERPKYNSDTDSEKTITMNISIKKFKSTLEKRYYKK